MKTRKRKNRGSTRKKGGSSQKVARASAALHEEPGYSFFSNIEELRSAIINYFKNPESQNEVIKKYGHISNWDTSRVTSMRELFQYINYGPGILHEPITLNWNTYNVTDMSYMFSDCKLDIHINFNDTSNVKNMLGMFNNNTVFNSPLDNLDVSNVINMAFMFDGATKFNQSLNKWELYENVNTYRIFGNSNNFNTKKYKMAFDRINNCFMWYYRKTIGKIDLSVLLPEVFTFDEMNKTLPQLLPSYVYIYISNLLDTKRKNKIQSIRAKGLPLTSEEKKQQNDYTIDVSRGLHDPDVIKGISEYINPNYTDFPYEGYQEYAEEYRDSESQDSESLDYE